MLESIKTSLASWLRAEVFALVGEAVKGHDEDRADMLNEIEALKGEIAALRDQVSTPQDILEIVSNNVPSAQKVADCISVSELRRALKGIDLEQEIKEAVSSHIEDMDLSNELGEQVENAISNSALPQEQVNDAIESCSETIAQAVVDNADFMEKLVAAIGEKLAGK